MSDKNKHNNAETPEHRPSCQPDAHRVDVQDSRLGGLRFCVYTHDPEVDRPVSKNLHATGIWEAFMSKQVLGLFDRVNLQTFFDVGANVGWYTMLAAAAMRRANLADGCVLALEPDDGNAALLARGIEANGFTRVTVLRAAASDRARSLQLHHDPENLGNHRVIDASTSGRPAGLNAIEAVSLDELAFDRAFGAPDAVKIDVQGHEAQVIAGMRRILAARDELVVFLEYEPASTDLYTILSQFSDAGLYHVDDQARVVVATDTEELQRIAPTFERSFFDLAIAVGERFRAAIESLPDFTHTARFRFLSGAWGLVERPPYGARWLGARAEAVVSPRPGFTGSAQVDGRLLRLAAGAQVTVTGPGDGRCDPPSLAVQPGEPFSMMVDLGQGDVHLTFDVIPSDATALTGPRLAQVTHIAVKPADGTRASF